MKGPGGGSEKFFKATPVIQIQDKAIGLRYRYKLKNGKLLLFDCFF